jgi:hypothetical protein
LYDLYSEELNKQPNRSLLQSWKESNNWIIQSSTLMAWFKVQNKIIVIGNERGTGCSTGKIRKASTLTSFFSGAAGYITDCP